MWRTRVGYAGGSLAKPTYRNLGDHTECFEVDYDPAVLSYSDVLEMFWTSHDPTRDARKAQYASVILARDDAQLAEARDSAQRLVEVVGRRLGTRIEMLDRFWMAEDYHQKYYLRHDRILFGELSAVYPQDADFVSSTTAARVNGYLYGAGSCLQLEREIAGFGLSEPGQRHLRGQCTG